jgi:hypothetical protein
MNAAVIETRTGPQRSEQGVRIPRRWRGVSTFSRNKRNESRFEFRQQIIMAHLH